MTFSIGGNLIWIKTAIDSLNPSSDLIWSESEDEYKYYKPNLYRGKN